MKNGIGNPMTIASTINFSGLTSSSRFRPCGNHAPANYRPAMRITLRRFRSAKRLIDSRPRSSTLAGLPVDISRLPPVPLSIFTVFHEKLFGPAPESAARSAHYRRSGQPLDTNRRSPGPDKIFPANPKLSPFRQVPDGCQRTLSN